MDEGRANQIRDEVLIDLLNQCGCPLCEQHAEIALVAVERVLSERDQEVK